jgi:tRNA(Arg) A34 adenosine deaminase TadA
MATAGFSNARRRLIFTTLRFGSGTLALGGLVSSVVDAGVAAASERRRFMARAFELRQRAIGRGDHGFGAVIVKDGVVVGEGANAVNTIPDPTAHGEVQAIRDAARRLGAARLSGCELFTNALPCPMCEAAAYWAGIERIYHGESIIDAGAPRRARC